MPSIKYKKKTYAGATFPVLEMTKAEYIALPEAKKMDGTVYMITDDDGGWEAERSVYDNTESGLTATNVQDALDELNSNVNKIVDVTNKVTFLASVNTNYTFFYKIGHVIYYQIYFSGSVATGANIATLDGSLSTTRQFWALAGSSGEGTKTKRINVSGVNITTIAPIDQYDFVSGWFILDVT